MVDEKNTFLIEMDGLHSIETPIYIQKKGTKKETK